MHPSLKDRLQDQAQHIAEKALIPSTRQFYEKAWLEFAGFCQERGLESLPASVDTYLLYVAEASKLLGHSAMKNRRSAIARMHRTHGLQSPTYHRSVRQVMLGLSRTGRLRRMPMKALTLEQLLMVLPSRTFVERKDWMWNLQTRALLLVGFVHAVRAEEIRRITHEGTTFEEKGVLLSGVRSKPMFVSRGKNQGTCPVEALEEWIIASQLTSGPVFRSVNTAGNLGSGAISVRTLRNIVREVVVRAGGDPTSMSFTSLRKGFFERANEIGMPLYRLKEIMDQWHVENLAGRTRRYVRRRRSR